MTLLPAHPKPPILLLGLAWAHPVLAADSTGTATYVAAVLAAIALAATVVAVLAVARARAPRPALEPPAAPEANLAEALEELDSLRRAQALEQTRLQAMQLILDGAPLASVLDSAAAFLESLDDDLLCVILLIDPATAAVRVGSAPRATATLIDALEGRSADTPAEPHPAGERLTLTDLQSHPYWRSIAGHLGDSGLSACHCEPVMDRAGEVLGALDVYSPVPDAPDADQRDWIRQTAGLVAFALQHERDHAARRAAEEQAQLLLISANEGIFGLDLDGVTTFINPTGARMLGYEPGELVGRPNHDLIHHSSAEGTPIPASECRMLEVTRSGDDILVSDEMFWRRDGSRFPVEYRATPIRRRGPIIGAVVVFHDITRRRRREQLIHQLAYYDNQTGLPNRSLFKRRLVQRLRSARRDQGPFAVHLLDLDGFKAVNDSLGHPFGDRLLQKTAKRLKTLVRESDLVARLGGDEFAVIQPDARTREDAALLAAKMVSRLALPYRIDAHEVHCSASLGVVMVQDLDSDADTLLARADVALYKAKGNGRGSYAFHTDAMTRKAHRDAALAQRLDQAVRDGELFLHYQPQVEMATGRIVALEALVRWRHPQEGVLPPKDFIHLAEQNGLFQVLGGWVITTAARQARAWMAQGLQFGRIAINVSPQQIRAGSLADDVIAAADDTGLPPDLIELELNEAALTEYGEQYRRQIALLREAGTRVCIDDFGAGVSSLTQLRRSGAHAIKIDREFVQGIEDSDAASNVVRALIALTESLGVDAIAEGVETVRQARRLSDLGCRYAQGRLWAPPLTTASLRPLLEAGTMGVRGDGGELSTTPEPLSTSTS